MTLEQAQWLPDNLNIPCKSAGGNDERLGAGAAYSNAF